MSLYRVKEKLPSGSWSEGVMADGADLVAEINDPNFTQSELPRHDELVEVEYLTVRGMKMIRICKA